MVGKGLIISGLPVGRRDRAVIIFMVSSVNPDRSMVKADNVVHSFRYMRLSQSSRSYPDLSPANPISSYSSPHDFPRWLDWLVPAETSQPVPLLLVPCRSFCQCSEKLLKMHSRRVSMRHEASAAACPIHGRRAPLPLVPLIQRYVVSSLLVGHTSYNALCLGDVFGSRGSPWRRRRDSLGGPAPVDRGLADPGARRDVVDGGPVEPVLEQELGRGRGDALVGPGVARTSPAASDLQVAGCFGVAVCWSAHASDPSRNSDTRQRNAYGYLRLAGSARHVLVTRQREPSPGRNTPRRGLKPGPTRVWVTGVVLVRQRGRDPDHSLPAHPSRG